MSYKICSYVRIWTDGASQRGKMGIGVVIRPGTQPTIYKEIYGLVDPVEKTSNHYVAEWSSLVVALNLCQTIPGLKQIDLFNDNETVIKQMNGEARIRKIHLAKLHEEAVRVIHTLKDQGVSRFNFYHVKKRHNNYADSLSQKAIEGEPVTLNFWEPLDDPITKPTPPPEPYQPEDPPQPVGDPRVKVEETPEQKASRAEQSASVKQYIEEKRALHAKEKQETEEGEVVSVDMVQDVNIEMSPEELQEVIDKAADLLEKKKKQEEPKKDKGFAGLKL